MSRDSVPVAEAMNRMTDTALPLCQHPYDEMAWLHLASFCGQNAISIPTMDAIDAYGRCFQPKREIRAADFEMTAKALLKPCETIDSRRAAVAWGVVKIVDMI
jgi:hypothetical protein